MRKMMPESSCGRSQRISAMSAGSRSSKATRSDSQSFFRISSSYSGLRKWPSIFLFEVEAEYAFLPDRARGFSMAKEAKAKVKPPPELDDQFGGEEHRKFPRARLNVPFQLWIGD